MKRDFYSNTEFTNLKERLNREILRRGTFSWWDPLTTPSVGQDKTPPLTIPDIGTRIQIDENTYTINNPSEGSIERTRNIFYPKQGENPAGQKPDPLSTSPNTSAAQLNVDEMRNFLVGLSKINDINLFYGRDETKYVAFRDTSGITEVLESAEESLLNKPLMETELNPTKNDPNGGIQDRQNPDYPVENHLVTYPIEDGQYVMPSGERDGEELSEYEGLGPSNFYDDYGAKPGDANYHPFNRHTSEYVRRDRNDQGNYRNDHKTMIIEGGIKSYKFGQNPRNPNPGSPYRSRPVYGGVPGGCNVACTGLCHVTCDNECSESCFKAGTLIETINGSVPIEEIKVGDMVLTQSGEYHRVYNTFKRKTNIDDLIILKANGVPPLYTTKNHPFWIKKYKGVTKTKLPDGEIYSHQYYSDPEWVEAKDISARDKMCLFYREPGNIVIDTGIAYMVGRWLGDGWVDIKTDNRRENYSMIEYRVCCGFHETVEFESLMDKLNIQYNKDKPGKNPTCQRYHILKTRDKSSLNYKLIGILSKCGRYSYGKFIPQEIFNWDLSSIQSLLKGYFDANGHLETNRNILKGTSVSKKLAYGISILVKMTGVNPSWTEKIYKDKKVCIQGREVNLHDSYILSICQNEFTRNYSTFDYDNNCIWSTVRTPIIPDETYDVYNISVEGDPTYYANFVLVHNCTTTCWNRCGEACTSTCGNVCTGCSTLCYTSCKTKCENSTGYSCLKAGAKAVKITTSGGKDGIPAKNTISIEIYTCNGCSYSCQFYPNKKTECWDSGCMGKCFTSCNTACSTSCFGGCIDNNAEGDNGTSYKTGKGKGCSAGCTLNCIGFCSGVCEGYCIQTCWHACKQTCSDNCSWKCSTDCGSGCFEGCTNGCTGCSACAGSCEGKTDSKGCTGCSIEGGCTSVCQHDCNSNCVGWGCRSICGIDAAGACEANCRLNCMATSCTSMCEDACAGRCTTCVNSCGWQCGPCTSQCSAGCESSCNINCTDTCKQDCMENCVNSCSELCGGCSDLCYSCVGMCIGICSVKCESGCSSCANNCGWWCDSSCNQKCFGSCDTFCINTCSGSCATFLESNTTLTSGPERDPISSGYIYPHPKNRYEERESFKIIREIKPYPSIDEKVEIPPKVLITFDDDRNFVVIPQVDIHYTVKQTSIDGGVFNVDHTTGEVTVNIDMLPGLIEVTKPNLDGGGGLFVVTLYYNPEYPINNGDIVVKLPFGFQSLKPIWDNDNNIIIIIQRDKFLFPEEEV